MGYHVAIVRTAGKRTIPITKDEVLSLGKAFPEWMYDANQGALVAANVRKAGPVLSFSDGELWTKNPSGDTLSSMITLAAHIGARVRGDELETYRTATDCYLHADDAEEKAAADARSQDAIRRTKRRQWIFNALMFGGFFFAAILVKKCGS